MSEVFGRSNVYKVTGLAYCLFILGSALSPTFGGLLVCRLLAGFLGGPCVAITGGTAADLFPERTRADCMSTLMMAGFLGSALGPVIGGFCAVYKGWRWTQYAALIVAATALLMLLPMEETSAKIILKRRAKKRGILPSDSAQDTSSGNFMRNILTIVLFRPLHMLVTEPIVTLFSIYNAFALGTLYGFFSAYPVVLKKVYGFNEWQTGLTFLSTCIGVLLG
jgi:MFS family permease